MVREVRQWPKPCCVGEARAEPTSPSAKRLSLQIHSQVRRFVVRANMFHKKASFTLTLVSLITVGISDRPSCINPSSVIGSYVSLLKSIKEVMACAWQPKDLRFKYSQPHTGTTSRTSLSGIIHHQVGRPHSVVRVENEFVVIQRTRGARLTNDLPKSHKRAQRGIRMFTVPNQNLQGVVLVSVGPL